MISEREKLLNYMDSKSSNEQQVMLILNPARDRWFFVDHFVIDYDCNIVEDVQNMVNDESIDLKTIYEHYTHYKEYVEQDIAQEIG